jgi:hypothetical protein
MYKKSLLYFVLLLSVAANSQRDSVSLSLKEECDLEHILYDYYALQHWGEEGNTGISRMGKPTEIVICVFGIDSSGKVGNISLLSDDKNRDSVFSIFSRMTPQNFKDWRCEKCGGKTLILPFIDFIENNSKKPAYYKNYLSSVSKTKELNNLIFIRTMFLYSSGTIEQFTGNNPDSSANDKPKPVKGVER